uniref:tRNA (34-2'-O)-methyltransferase regulator WDR6 n=1 Tax=Culicoides sonorensis TaxID=179676 RepID=A0A336LEW1_CULSO
MLITDALCVRFLSENELFAGLGNQLQYFYVDEKLQTIRKICSIRTKYKISNIIINRLAENIQIVASAGSDLLVTCLENHEFVIKFTLKINDWINAIHFNASKPDILHLVTAHNRASAISLDFSKKNGLILKRSRCQEISTAYASLIYGDSWKNLLFLAGTAFGELIIWSPSNIQCNDDIGIILIRIPNSHNGVIFNIDLNMEASLLTTASDDRSIQLWKITLNDLDMKKPSIEKIKRCFAHTSRVFRSKIIKKDENFYILSIGEDSHVCLWDDAGNLIYKKYLENCGTIWGLDYCKITETVVVSTNNGRLLKIPLAEQFNGSSIRENVIETREKGNSIVKLKYISIRIAINVTQGLLICLTELNQILVYDENSEMKNSFQLETGTSKICLMETCGQYAYFVTTDSEIFLYEYELNSTSQDFVLKCHEKIHWNSSCEDKKGENRKIRSIIRSLNSLGHDRIVICSSQGHILVLNSLTLKMMFEFYLPKSAEPWITSAISIGCGFLIGDRCGHLHLYKNCNKNPIHTLRRLHGNMGITQIIKINSNTFTTTGHDSACRTIKLENDRLKHIFAQKTSNINLIERLHHQYIFGFNSSYFICHHEKNGTIFEHNCGGGNRQFDLYLNAIEPKHEFSLAVIQQRRVKQVTFKLKSTKENSLEFPDVRWHHLDCNFIKIIESSTSLLITGGEDTLMKFYQMQEDGNEMNLNLLRTSNQHNSGIKSIIATKSEINDDTFVISVGSRAKICISRLKFLKSSEYSIEEELQFMLYSDEEKLKPENEQQISFDPESSFTSVALVKNGEDNQLVCGCSDGYLRTFNVKLESNPITITLDKEIYYGKSILHVEKIEYKNFTLILSMGTDGIINFWNSSSFDGIIHQLRHHESGIHAYDCMMDENSDLLIATGGDDQSICVSKISFQVKEEEKLSIEVQKTFKIPDLHTAQVTGVRFLDDSTLITTGIDQTIHEIHFDLKMNKKDNRRSWWTSVEDAKGLLTFRDKIIVYGNGLEIL